MKLNELSNNELINTYSNIVSLLKERNVIRTKNLVGDLGEYLAIEYFNKTPGMSNLQAAPAGTQNIDAISRNGQRYSVKSTTGNLTGVFYGLESKGSDVIDSQKFEFVLIVKFSENYELEKIIQVDWAMFLKHKKWHSTMRAWNLTLTKELEKDSLVIFKK